MNKEYILPAAVALIAIAVALLILFGTAVEAPSLPQRGAGEGEGPVVGSKNLGGDSDAGVSAAQIIPNSPPSVPASTPAAPQAPVAASPQEVVLTKIDDAIVTYSPEGVDIIAPYLASKDPEIRAAAIEGLKQLGEPEGAARLREVARGITNQRDRKELLDAADFIELPPVEVEWVEQ
jgi:hypothetical protein